MFLDLVHKFLCFQARAKIANPQAIVRLGITYIASYSRVKRFKPGLLGVYIPALKPGEYLHSKPRGRNSASATLRPAQFQSPGNKAVDLRIFNYNYPALFLALGELYKKETYKKSYDQLTAHWLIYSYSVTVLIFFAASARTSIVPADLLLHANWLHFL